MSFAVLCLFLPAGTNINEANCQLPLHFFTLWASFNMRCQVIQARGRICDLSNAGISVEHQIVTLTVMNVVSFKSVPEKKKKN